MSVRPGTCPTCGKRAPYVASNPWRPFCSERCRSIDLGAWASGAYSIPAKEEDAPGSETDTNER